MTLSRGGTTPNSGRPYASRDKSAGAPFEARIESCGYMLQTAVEFVPFRASTRLCSNLLDLVVEGLDQAHNLVKCLQTVPMANALHNLQPLLASPHLRKHLLAPFERCAFIFVASKDQYGNVNLAVIGWLGVDNYTTIRNIPRRILTEEKFPNKGFCQGRRFLPNCSMRDGICHWLHPLVLHRFYSLLKYRDHVLVRVHWPYQDCCYNTITPFRSQMCSNNSS